MAKGFVGSSVLPDAQAAGKEAAAKLKKGLEAPKVIFCYSGVQYDQAAMLKGVGEEFPGIPVLGNTSFTGVITPEGFITGDKGFVGLLGIGGDDITVGVAGMKKTKGARAIGHEAAAQAMKAAGKDTPPDYWYMAAAPAEEEFFIKGVSEVIGRKPFFGGSAADNTIAGEWLLYTDEQHGDGVFADGIVTAFFWGKPVTNVFTGAYEETDDVGIITKVRDNRTLVEIDGEPALKKYAAWRGVDPDTIKGGALLAFTITSPLGVKDRLGELTAIRHPMGGTDDYAMNIGANLAEKTAVIRMKGDQDHLVKTGIETVELLKDRMAACGELYGHKREPAAFLLVHCGGRRAGIAEKIDELAAGVKKAAGDVPFLMQFTFGEYGWVDDGNNTTGGLMLSYTGFEK
jgi:hypothetical protein